MVFGDQEALLLGVDGLAFTQAEGMPIGGRSVMGSPAASDLLFGRSDAPVTDDRSLIGRLLDFANGETLIDADSRVRGMQVRELDASDDRIVYRAPTMQKGRLILSELTLEEANEYAKRAIDSTRNTVVHVLNSAVTGELKSIEASVVEALRAGAGDGIVKQPLISRVGAAPNSWRLTFRLAGPNVALPWLVYASVLLLTDVDQVRTDLGRCRLERCSKFFFVVRGGLGKPRTNYCCAEHRIEHHNGPDSARRSREARERRRNMPKRSAVKTRSSQR